jgi:hypothetical protein
VRQAGTSEDVLSILQEYVSNADPGMHFVGILINNGESKLLDYDLIKRTLQGKNMVGERLLRHNQILRAKEALNKRCKDGIPTNRIVLTPRDPKLDREAEISDLLMIQLRVQLKQLHAVGVFVNSRLDEFSNHISYVYGIQKHIAKSISVPIGTTYIQYAPLLVQ